MMMKKRLTAILLALLIVLFSCSALAESKQTHGAAIKSQLDALNTALGAGNKPGAQSALMSLRSAVYNGAMYLARIGQYDSRVLSRAAVW